MMPPGVSLTTTDANGATIQYTYDALGRVLTKTFPDHTTASFTYDATGNLLTATNPHLSYTFSYDLTNRLTAVTDSRGLTLGYQYDALGQPHPDDVPGWLGGLLRLRSGGPAGGADARRARPSRLTTIAQAAGPA